MGALSVVLAGHAARAQCEYEVTIVEPDECPILGFPPLATGGMNEFGHFVGYHWQCGFDNWGDDQAYAWDPDSGIRDLEMPAGATESRGSDINDAGQAVGWFDDDTDEFGSLGFLTHRKDLTVIKPPAGSFCHPYAINNPGQVAGATADGTPYYKAFVWQEGVMTIIEPTIRPRSVAYDISDRGDVVGWMGTSILDRHAFRWTDGELFDLGPIPGGLSSNANAINELRQIVGSGALPDPEQELVSHAFLYTDGRMIDLGVLPGFVHSAALDINDVGQVVGGCWIGGLTGFIYQDGRMLDLNTLIPPDSGLVIGSASAVNDQGVIVAWGWTLGPGGHDVGILLTPGNRPLGDLDVDCRVDHTDLGILLDSWGPCPACPGDLDLDGRVGTSDLLMLLANWG